jgi:hypothetical protein
MTDTNQAPKAESAEAPRAHCIGPAIDAMLKGFFPEETRAHFRNARIEMLRGFRSIIDARIQHLSQTQEKGTTVTVE